MNELQEKIAAIRIKRILKNIAKNLFFGHLLNYLNSKQPEKGNLSKSLSKKIMAIEVVRVSLEE